MEQKKGVKTATSSPKKPEVKKETAPGLEQWFLNTDKKSVALTDFLKKEDWWESKGRSRRVVILKHDAVKRIARAAGVKIIEYKVLTQPDVYNNFQYAIQALVRYDDEDFIEIGESNRSNLGGKGRNNPANMAQKRAYDRAVLSALGITGILSEEELSDEQEDKMEILTHEEKKGIAPLLNQILLAKNKKDLDAFNKTMKSEASKFNEQQLDYLRKLFKKRSAEFTKSF